MRSYEKGRLPWNFWLRCRILLQSVRPQESGLRVWPESHSPDVSLNAHGYPKPDSSQAAPTETYRSCPNPTRTAETMATTTIQAPAQTRAQSQSTTWIVSERADLLWFTLGGASAGYLFW